MSPPGASSPTLEADPQSASTSPAVNAGPASVCSRNFSSSSWCPERAAEAERSRSKKDGSDGGVRSSSDATRRTRSSAGGFRACTRRAMGGAGRPFGSTPGALSAGGRLATARLAAGTAVFRIGGVRGAGALFWAGRAPADAGGPDGRADRVETALPADRRGGVARESAFRAGRAGGLAGRRRAVGVRAAGALVDCVLAFRAPRGGGPETRFLAVARGTGRADLGATFFFRALAAGRGRLDRPATGNVRAAVRPAARALFGFAIAESFHTSGAPGGRPF